MIKSPYPFWFRGMGLFNQFRTVVLDHAIIASQPVDQLVILGAGFDTRAWRLEGLNKTTVFEVDQLATQALKQSNLKGLASKVAKMEYVAVDFSKDDLANKLMDKGFAPSKKTFWLWEGVTMYLTPEDVARNLKVLKTLSAAQSQVALTYINKHKGRVPQSWFLTLLGEPVRSAFEPMEVKSLTRNCGWEVISDSGIEDWKLAFAPDLILTRRQVGLQWGERIWVGRIEK